MDLNEWVFFQIVNYGVPFGDLARTMASIKGFHEQPTEMADVYSRIVVKDDGWSLRKKKVSLKINILIKGLNII